MRRAQEGVVLLFGLVVMVALALAAVAIVRSVDTVTRVSGAISLKQDATSAAAVGAEKAIEWLQGNLAGKRLESDHPEFGYYASSLDAIDATGNRTSSSQQLRLVHWGGKCESVSGAYSTCNTEPADPIVINGNRVEWIITRLCAGPGTAGGVNSCAMPRSSGGPSTSDRGQVGSGGRIVYGTATPYFRIIVRVEGPRKTVSVTEQLVHF